MLIRKYASQFSICLYSQDVDLSVKSRTQLLGAGYTVFGGVNLSEMLSELRSNPPHVIILDLMGMNQPLDSIVEKVLEISSEIKFIFMTDDEDVSDFENYFHYNLLGVVNRATNSWHRVILSLVDLACESLYRTYQNEHLLQKLQNAEESKKQLEDRLETERLGPTVRPYQTRIAQFKTAKTKEELMDVFYENTPQQSWIYLKNIASIQTLVAVSYTNVPEDWVEGFSFKIPNGESDFHEKIIQGEIPESLMKYIQDKLNKTNFKFLPMIVKGQIEGLLITPQDISSEVAEDFSLMSLVYTLLVYESQPKFLDVEDQLTGFYNQLFYKRILDKEIDRAQRALVAISVIKIGIDQLTEIETVYGSLVVSEVIKSVAEAIKKTSRLQDYICRTDTNEFSLVLVQCNKEGAAIRAERLKKAISEITFAKFDLKVTVSQGISEYPTLADSVVQLDDTARRALEFISQKGENKICLYKAPLSYKPIYRVLDE